MDANRFWTAFGAVSCGLTTLIAGGIAFVAWKAHTEHQLRQAELAKLLEGIKKNQETAVATNLVKADDVTNNCYANNTGVTCTLTNMTTEPVTTCVKGRLAQKKADGVTLHSLPVCTGRIGPRETKATTAPWVGGFAKDICFSTDRWKNQVLDWEACIFVTEPVKLSKAGENR